MGDEISHHRSFSESQALAALHACSRLATISRDGEVATTVVHLESSDDSNSPGIDTEPVANGSKRKSTGSRLTTISRDGEVATKVVHLDSSDDSNSPDIDMEPVANGSKRKSTGSRLTTISRDGEVATKVVHLDSSDDSNSPDIDMEPVANGSKRKSTGSRLTTISPDGDGAINVVHLESSDDSNSPDIDTEPVANGSKRKSTGSRLTTISPDGDGAINVVHLDSSDDSNSPGIDMEPVANGSKRKSTGSSESKNKKISNKALERQTKKQKLAEEKMAKEATAKLNKVYKPGECMKYMNIEGHPSLWARWYMSDVPREAAQHGAHVTQAQKLCNPALIVWTRTIPRTLDKEGGQVKLSPVREPCDRALYVAEVEELCEMVNAHTLSSHLSQIRQLCDCKLTLLVFRANDYFNKGRTKTSVHRAPRRKTTNSNRNQLTEIDFELAITDLLVTADVDTVIVNTASELALTILQFTKAIAEAPIKKAKRACDDKAAFFMRGDNKNCIAVDKDGVGVGRLWQQMLAVLPHSSLETARAICAQYKSPLALYESLKSADSVAKLADIGVSRAAVTTARARRVGPEFARKLHTLFTATDGDQLIE